MRYDEISLKVREIVAHLFERDAATLSEEDCKAIIEAGKPTGTKFRARQTKKGK